MEFLAESIPGMLGAAATLTPILQSHRQHVAEVQTAIELHKQAIRQAEEFHKKEHELAKDLHHKEVALSEALHDESQQLTQLLHQEGLRTGYALHSESKQLALQLHVEGLAQNLRHHTQEIKIAIEAARRENLRDVWSQKNRKADTLLITSTLMFAAFIAMIVEGRPPPEAHKGLIVSYSVLVSVSFSLIFLCMWLTMKYQSRMADFNLYNKHQKYICGKHHRSFESFYMCHCSRLAKLANKCFYLGTASLVLSTAVVMWARFEEDFDNMPAAVIYVVLVAVTVILMFFLQRLFPSRTRDPTSSESKEHILPSFLLNDDDGTTKSEDSGAINGGNEIDAMASFLHAQREAQEEARIASEQQAAWEEAVTAAQALQQPTDGDTAKLAAMMSDGDDPNRMMLRRKSFFDNDDGSGESEDDEGSFAASSMFDSGSSDDEGSAFVTPPVKRKQSQHNRPPQPQSAPDSPSRTADMASLGGRSIHSQHSAYSHASQGLAARPAVGTGGNTFDRQFTDENCLQVPTQRPSWRRSGSPNASPPQGRQAWRTTRSPNASPPTRRSWRAGPTVATAANTNSRLLATSPSASVLERMSYASAKEDSDIELTARSMSMPMASQENGVARHRSPPRRSVSDVNIQSDVV